MAEPRDRMEEALWRRWRSMAGGDGVATAEADPLLLAAYVEDRVSDDERDIVEEWLFADPSLAADVLAARRAGEAALPETPASLLAWAMALVGLGGDAQIFVFRRQVTRWRAVAAWGGMAASLAVTGLVGFNLGTDAYMNVAGDAPAALSEDLLDPPAGLFNNGDEDSTI
jgi:anti-sigma factor RsiW